MTTSLPAIFLMGPTASGKTDLAVELTRHFPCAIISVDSAMIYRGMDIGTAKPGPEILRVAPHRLIDILDPAEAYSAAQFCADAAREMREIMAAGRIPLLVGGTMLYFRALQRGLVRSSPGRCGGAGAPRSTGPGAGLGLSPPAAVPPSTPWPGPAFIPTIPSVFSAPWRSTSSAGSR